MTKLSQKNCALKMIWNMKDKIDKIKEKIAKEAGYRDDILGTAWNYAMMLTHRTKRQISLYEKVISALANER